MFPDQRRMCGHDDLGVGQEGHQGGEQTHLPLRMEVQLWLIDQENPPKGLGAGDERDHHVQDLYLARAERIEGAYPFLLMKKIQVPLGLFSVVRIGEVQVQVGAIGSELPPEAIEFVQPLEV